MVKPFPPGTGLQPARGAIGPLTPSEVALVVDNDRLTGIFTTIDAMDVLAAVLEGGAALPGAAAQGISLCVRADPLPRYVPGMRIRPALPHVSGSAGGVNNVSIAREVPVKSGAMDAFEDVRAGRSEAVSGWEYGMLRRGLVSPALVSSLANPEGTLSRVLADAGIRVDAGSNYQPRLFDDGARSTAPKERGSFIPMVMYEADEAQLSRLRESFPLPTKNPLSMALGQSENRGLVLHDPHNEGRRTLWRMAVYPVEGEPGRYRVGFYGETLPEWAQGQGMIHLGGLNLGYRAGADTEVGKPIPPHVQLVDALLRRLGAHTR